MRLFAEVETGFKGQKFGASDEFAIVNDGLVPGLCGAIIGLVVGGLCTFTTFLSSIEDGAQILRNKLKSWVIGAVGAVLIIANDANASDQCFKFYATGANNKCAVCGA